MQAMGTEQAVGTEQAMGTVPAVGTEQAGQGPSPGLQDEEEDSLEEASLKTVTLLTGGHSRWFTSFPDVSTVSFLDTWR